MLSWNSPGIDTYFEDDSNLFGNLSAHYTAPEGNIVRGMSSYIVIYQKSACTRIILVSIIPLGGVS